MTVREYLGQIWEINERINKELRKLEDIKSRLYSSGIDYSKPRVQTSPRDTMAHIYAEIDEQERYVTELIDKLADLKATVTEQINGIETPLCRYVLHQHYVNCINMTDLSALSHINRTTLYRIRDAGLVEFGRLHGVGEMKTLEMNTDSVL